jgi:hypothetical protein
MNELPITIGNEAERDIWHTRRYLGPGSGYFGQQCVVLLAGAREVWICQKDGRMLFTGLTNDEMAKIIPLCCSDSQHLQSCQR